MTRQMQISIRILPSFLKNNDNRWINYTTLLHIHKRFLNLRLYKWYPQLVTVYKFTIE